MGQSSELIIFSTVYTVLAMILVTLDGTYNITQALFGGIMPDGSEYGKGMSLKNPGFYVHTVLFALLIALPMLMCKAEH